MYFDYDLSSHSFFDRVDLCVERVGDEDVTATLFRDGDTVTSTLLTRPARRGLLRLTCDLGADRVEVSGARVALAYSWNSRRVIDDGVTTFAPQSPSGRARAHITPPTGWLNDPNGLCFFRGVYHVFYQFTPYSPHWDVMHWGHAVSSDLIHWRNLPIFLVPQADLMEDSPLTGGAFSGSALPLDTHGRPCDGHDAERLLIALTRHRENANEPESVIETQTILETSDGVLPGAETTVLVGGDDVGRDWRDPKLVVDDDGVHMVLATTIDRACARARTALDPGDGEFTRSATSSDSQPEPPSVERLPAIVSYLHATGEPWTSGWSNEGALVADVGLAGSTTLECPDVVTVDGRRYALAGIMHYRRAGGAFQPVRWYDLDSNPTVTGWLDEGDSFYASQTLVESDRILAWGWLADWQGRRDVLDHLNQGVLSLPREVVVTKRGLGMIPAREIRALISSAPPATSECSSTYALDMCASIIDDVTITFSESASVPVLRIRQGNVMLTRPDGSHCHAELTHVHSLTAIYDRGVVEVFVNHGEATFSCLGNDLCDTSSLRLEGLSDEVSCRIVDLSSFFERQ